MNLRRSKVVAVLGLMLTAGALAAAPTALANIVIGQSIAGWKLGSSEAQIINILGQPTLKQPPDDQGNVEWNYAKPPMLGALGLIDGQLTGMWTSKQQKTSKGIGVGSTVAQVRKAYPKAKCSPTRNSSR